MSTLELLGAGIASCCWLTLLLFVFRLAGVASLIAGSGCLAAFEFRLVFNRVVNWLGLLIFKDEFV